MIPRTRYRLTHTKRQADAEALLRQVSEGKVDAGVDG